MDFHYIFKMLKKLGYKELENNPGVFVKNHETAAEIVIVLENKYTKINIGRSYVYLDNIAITSEEELDYFKAAVYEFKSDLLKIEEMLKNER